LSVQKPDTEKLSAYECGFDPYEDARNAFDVRFYIVAILFIIFDLEAIFLFPFVISISYTNSMGFWVMLDFLAELIIGFLYAWKIGSLEWD
jgi:NADH-quinone oxidoreductase subunit A